MKRIYINNIIRVALMIAVQLLIFNNVYLVGFLIPIIYAYAILKLPLEMPRMWVLILSFLIGGLIDVCMGTYGINAAATTFVGFLRPYIARYMFGDTEEGREITPSVQEFGLSSFLGYASILMTIHIAVILMLETFTLANFLQSLVRILLSSAFSIFLVVLIDVLLQSTTSKKKSFS